MALQNFEINGVNLACEVRGTGAAVVLVHGFPLDHEMWAAQFDELSREFRVIAPDLRGFGKSTLTADDVEHGVGMERYAADVFAVLDALGVSEPVVLAGFSMGGYAAWQAALRHPSRLRGLAQCDTRAVADNDEGRAGRHKLADAVLAAGDASPAFAMLPKLLAGQTHDSRPEIVAQVRAMIERQSPQAIAAALRGMARRDDVTPRLGEIKMPCLCLAGAHDAISAPKEMKEIAAALPRAQFVEISDAGHMTTLENPAATTAALRDFVQSVEN